MYSLISIKNKPNIYQEFLLNLQQQKKVDYELITIDNCNGEYNSARLAYNEAIKKASGKYIIFIHPDIRFMNSHALFDILTCIDSLSNFGVIGVAGSPTRRINGKRVILSNILHGLNQQPAGIKIEEPLQVQTLDECFFLIQASLLKQHPFSNEKGWHLYAVEYCLQAISYHKKNYVVPADILHLSDGKSLDYHYVLQLKRIIAKYKSTTKVINTTVNGWNTRGFLSRIYINYFLVKQWLKANVERIK